MNERIAKLLAETSAFGPGGETMDRYNCSLNDLEKFAQLIVEECAKVILETPVEYNEIDAMQRIRDNVKNHFGVEE